MVLQISKMLTKRLGCGKNEKMDDQLLTTSLGLHSLFASSLLLEILYNWRNKKRVLTPHFVGSLTLFLVFSLAFLVR